MIWQGCYRFMSYNMQPQPVVEKTGTGSQHQLPLIRNMKNNQQGKKVNFRRPARHCKWWCTPMLKLLAYGCVSIYTSSNLWKLTFCSANVSHSWPHCSIATAVGLQQLMPTISAHVPAPPPLAQLLVRGHLSAKSPAGKFFPCIAPFPLWTALAQIPQSRNLLVYSLYQLAASHTQTGCGVLDGGTITLCLSSSICNRMLSSSKWSRSTLSWWRSASFRCSAIWSPALRNSLWVNSSSAPLSWETDSTYRKELSSC